MGIFRTPHKISRRMILFSPGPLYFAGVISEPLSFGALTPMATSMATSPPRPPLCNIPTNRTLVPSPKHPTVPIPAANVARAPHHAPVNHYRQSVSLFCSFCLRYQAREAQSCGKRTVINGTTSRSGSHGRPSNDDAASSSIINNHD